VIRPWHKAQMLLNGKIERNAEEADVLASLNPILVLLYLLMIASATTGLFGFR
jgi:hypothetical protein